MKEIAERIATKVESIYTGLVAVHNLLVFEIEKAITYDYTVVSVYEAIDRIYPLGNMPTLYLINIIAREMSL